MTGEESFAVNVSRLRRVPGARRHVRATGRIAELSVSGSRVPEEAEVDVDVTLEAITGGISVAGSVRAPWEGVCRRCLAGAVGVLRVPLRELYLPHGDGADAYPLTGDVVDLALAAHDAVLLSLPPAPLCSPECLGLCPVCGADLGRDPCGGHTRRDERWAVLDALRVTGDKG